MEKVFDVVRLVDEGATTAADIAESLDVVPRQGLYYIGAAVALQLVEPVDRDENGVTYAVTTHGRLFLRGPESKRARRRAVMNSPVVRFVAAELGSQARYPLDAVLLDTEKIAKALSKLGLGPETAERRAYTVKAWLKHLM